MDKLNLKNVLTAVRDMIMRNRVAYKDYLGTDENGNKIYDTKLVPVELLPNIPSKLLPKTLATKREVQAVEYTANDALSTAYTAQTAANNARSTADNAQAAANTAKSTANTANTTAENANTTAENAKTTANAAKTMANAAATKENPVFTGTFSQNRKVSSGIGDYSHAEGRNATASGYCSHAEGIQTTASGSCSHAEGSNTTASGDYSHAEGDSTTASGSYSHAEGCLTTASGDFSHVQGKYNIEDSSNTYAHITGNGNAVNNRSNAHTLDWSGNAWFAGDVYTGSTSGTNKDEGSKKLATEEYVDKAISQKPNLNPLTFTGAVTGSYDGSAAVNIEIPESVEIDNETIVKTEDGKLKANISLPNPAKNGSLLRGDTNNSKWSEIDANGGYGWKEIKAPIVYTSDMYDSAEKLYYTDAETGEQSVILVKVSDDVVTLEEAKSICSLTTSGEGASVTYDFAEPPYSNYVAQFGTTGVSLMGIQVMSCSQEENAQDLLGTAEPFIIPAGTWLQADIASSFSSAEIAHGTINKIEEAYVPSNIVIFNRYAVLDDQSFNENIRAKFYKGLTLLTDDYDLILSVSSSESSFTCAKSDGLLYKYTLTDGNWSSSEIFLQSSALFTDDITGLTASFNEVPCTQSVYNLVSSRALPSGRYDGDIAIWDTTNKRWKIATQADGGYGYVDDTTGETFKISDRFLPDNAVKIKEITDDHVLHSHIKDDLESGYTVYWNVGAYPNEGGRIINWEIVSDEVPTNCKYILTFDRSPGVKKIYTPNADYNHLIIYNYTAEPTQKALYLNSSTADSKKFFKITVDDSGTISATEVT